MVDIFQFSKEKLWVPGRGWVPMDAFAEEMKKGASIANPRQFESFLPDEEVIRAGQSGSADIQAILTNERKQAGRGLQNLQQAITTAFFNKIFDTMGGGPGFAGSALTDSLPDYNELFTRGLKGLRQVISGEISMAELGQMALDAAFTGAIKILSKIPIVGQILAAIVAVAYMIVKLVQRNKQMKLSASDIGIMKGETSLPEMPTLGKLGDQFVMQEVVIPRMGSMDWTPLFQPRFDWSQDWVGRLYKEGMAFAPGKPGSSRGSDYFKNSEFAGGQGDESTFGLGYIPGTQQITSAVQVLSPILGIQHQPYNILGTKLEKPTGGVYAMMAKLLYNGPPHIFGMAYNNSGKAVGPGNVRDEGDFYPSAAQVMTSVWGSMQADGNPDIYRMDTNAVDKAWQEYCGNGMEYVQSIVQWKFFPTSQINDEIEKEFGVDRKRKDSKASWRTRRRKAAESVFAGGVACAIGSWRCRQYGNTFSLSHPSDISKSIRFETSAGKSSLDPTLKDCVAGFNDWVKAKDDGLCLGNMYDDFIKEKVKKIRSRQWSMLASTMVCAYVKKDFIAFKKSKNLNKRLNDMRKVLLGRPDQWQYIVEQDVPRDEKLEDGRNLYEELRKRGAFKKSFEKTLTAAPKRLPVRMLKPESRVFQLIPGAVLEPGSGVSGRVPGEEYVPPGGMGGGSSGGGSALPVLAVAALAFLVLSKK